MTSTLRQHATTITICAIFAAVAIAGSATAATLITGADIKNNTISSADIKDRTIQPGDFSLDAGRALQGPRGPAGPRGLQGEPGPAGTGGAGLTGLERVTASFPAATPPASAVYIATGGVSCPAGKYMLTSGHAFTATETTGQTITLLQDTITAATNGAPNGVQLNATATRSFTLAIEVYCAAFQ